MAQVTADLAVFKADVTNFDAAQGGIFQARFDTELLGDLSTIGAEVGKILEGFATNNKALVAAAADQMHQNAADVGGNNVPVNGGMYDTNGTTVAQVLATTGTGTAAATSGAAAAAAISAIATAATPAAADMSHSTTVDMSHLVAAETSHQDMSHQLHQMWA